MSIKRPLFVLLIVLALTLIACADTPNTNVPSAPPVVTPSNPTTPSQPSNPQTPTTPTTKSLEDALREHYVASGATAYQTMGALNPYTSDDLTVSAVSVISLDDKDGVITAKFSGTYKSEAFQEKEVTFTSLTKAVDHGQVMSSSAISLKVADLIAADLKANQVTTASSIAADSIILMTYLNAFSLFYSDGTEVSNQSNSGIALKNIEAAQDGKSLKLTFAIDSWYFRKSADGALEQVHTEKNDFQTTMSWYSEVDVLNVMVKDPALVLPGDHSGTYASKYYAEQTRNDNKIWTEFFDRALVEKYQALFFPTLQEPLIVSIANDNLTPDDKEGTLSIIYQIADSENNLQSSVSQELKVTGFANFQEEKSLSDLVGSLFILSDKGKHAYDKYHTQFLNSGVSKTEDKETVVATFDGVQPTIMVREQEHDAPYVLSTMYADPSTTNNWYIIWRGDSLTNMMNANTGLYNKTFQVKTITIVPVKIVVNPTKQYGTGNLYPYAYDVVFQVDVTYHGGSASWTTNMPLR